MPTAAEMLALLQHQTATPQAVPAEKFVEERAAWAPPPQPQHFVLQLPPDLTTAWLEELELFKQYTEEGQLVVNTSPAPIPWPDYPNVPGAPPKMIAPGEPIPGQAWLKDPGLRVVMVFDSVNVLRIVADQERGGSHVGEPLFTRISNVERNRSFKPSPPWYCSDAQYLYRALFIRDGVDPTLWPAGAVPRVDLTRGDNLNLIRVMVQHGPNRLFQADWEWSGRCSPNRVSQMLIEGQTVPVDRIVQGQPIMGCGHSVRQRDWPKDPATGLYLAQITCPGTFGPGPYQGQRCGALLKPFGSLVRFASYDGPAPAKG